MAREILLCYLLFSLFVSLSSSEPAYAITKSDVIKFNKYSKEGLALYGAKSYKNSIDKFKLASEINPSNIPVRYYLGMAAFFCKEYDLAAKELGKVVVSASKNSTYYKNAVKCFSDYKKELNHSKPYNCADNSAKYFRWSKDKYPLKVFISHGLKLPKGYREKPLNKTEIHKISGWLRSKNFVSSIRRDKHYQDSFWKNAKEGVSEWGFARSNKLIDFKLVKDPYQANIVVFWCSKLQGNKSATTTVPDKFGDKAVIQIAVEYILQLQAHHRGDAVRYITAHEFGHALGLGNSPFNRDIMFPIENTKRHKSGFHPGGANRVSINDSATLKALYSLPVYQKQKK